MQPASDITNLETNTIMPELGPSNMPVALLERLRDDASINDYESWCATDGAQLTPMLAVNLPYDKKHAMFALPEPKELRKCLASSTHPAITQDIKDGKCDWDSVMEARDSCLDAVEKGMKDYEERGAKNPLRRFARQGGDTWAAMLMPLLDMIPDDTGLRYLRCGLVAIFKVDCPIHDGPWSEILTER